jgi:hypothetical protein
MPLQCCKDKWPTIPDDEPVFVIRGKDLLAIKVVRKWIAEAFKAGVNLEKMEAVQLHLQAIIDFQRDHPERCKIPD